MYLTHFIYHFRKLNLLHFWRQHVPDLLTFAICHLTLKAGSHRKDYERIQLKTDLRLVNIIKSEGKPFHICLKNMFSNYFLKLFFKIHNLSLSYTPAYTSSLSQSSLCEPAFKPKA